MRHVKYDPAKLKYPLNWATDAAKAKKDVEDADDAADRSNEVNKHRKVWADLKPELSKVFHGKCWYTEAPQKNAGTDTDVDHFRPKNAVKGVKRINSNGVTEEHPGYWWLAFDPSNYRYSCIIANRPRRDIETGMVGGKVDEFPISDEKFRCWCSTDDRDDEQPLLIDPCNQAEVAWITFAENGEALTRFNEIEKPRLFLKAKTSIKFYHLNHSDFINARIDIRDELLKYIEDAKRYYKRLDEGDATIDHAYERSIEHLRNARSEKAPFSSFAVAFLDTYIGEESLAPIFL